MAHFPQNRFPRHFCGHLEFLHKFKNEFILITVQDRAISIKNFNLLATSPKICFPDIFVGHLKFLRNMQLRIYLGNGARISDFDKIFDLVTFSKNRFPPFLVAILNFCIKCKNAFISETVRDSDFNQHFVSAESTGNFFPKNCFPAIFGGHLEFLCNAKKKKKYAYMYKTLYFGINGKTY